MKTKITLSKALAFITILALITSCNTDDVEASRDIEINNDQEALSARMIEKNQTININYNESGKKSKELKLTLKAQLIPPTVDSNLLQATSVSLSGGSFLVSYNMAGETYHGGIDLIDGNLKLKSEIQFNDADINDVTIIGSAAYFAGGTSSLESPAFVEKISIKKGVFSLDDNARINIGSYTATSITNSGQSIYVTSGNDKSQGGGIYQLTKDLAQQNYQGIEDARWVAEADGVVYCLSGNPASVNSFDTNLIAQFDFEHMAPSDAESKMTMDIDDELIFIAGGDKGLLVYDLEGNFVSQYEFDDNSITNAVTSDNGIVFISNGEGGVHVASYEDEEITMLGKLELDDHESVNHILHRGNKLYVASGLGGIKMIEVKK